MINLDINNLNPEERTFLQGVVNDQDNDNNENSNDNPHDSHQEEDEEVSALLLNTSSVSDLMQNQQDENQDQSHSQPLLSENNSIENNERVPLVKSSKAKPKKRKRDKEGRIDNLSSENQLSQVSSPILISNR